MRMQPRSGYVLQPNVAAQRLRWVSVNTIDSTLKGLDLPQPRWGCRDEFVSSSQGSRFASTLGFDTQPLRG